MKRVIVVTAVLITVICAFCACGGAVADITSSWVIEQMTVNGKKFDYTLIPIDTKAPAFSCSDGKNLTFSLNGKKHNGTLTESGGVYTVEFDDSAKDMEARIENNKLILKTKDSDNIELVFKLK